MPKNKHGKLHTTFEQVVLYNWRSVNAPDPKMLEEIGYATPETAEDVVRAAIAARLVQPSQQGQHETVSRQAMTAPEAELHAAEVAHAGRPDDMTTDGTPYIR